MKETYFKYVDKEGFTGLIFLVFPEKNIYWEWKEVFCVFFYLDILLFTLLLLKYPYAIYYTSVKEIDLFSHWKPKKTWSYPSAHFLIPFGLLSE